MGRGLTCAIVILLGLAFELEAIASRRAASLSVHVVLDRFVPTDMGPVHPAAWRPQSNRLVHVVGKNWRDSTWTNELGDAWFPAVPPGHATVWCNDVMDLGNPETVLAGGRVRILADTTTTDTLWLECQIMGVFR